MLKEAVSVEVQEKSKLISASSNENLPKIMRGLPQPFQDSRTNSRQSMKVEQRQEESKLDNFKLDMSTENIELELANIMRGGPISMEEEKQPG